MVNSTELKLHSKFRFLFEPKPPKIHKKFPATINLKEIDILTQMSFKEEFLEAQKNGFPYYILAVAESESPTDKSPAYNLYTSASLRSHKIQCLNQNKEFTSPLTRLTIQKIYYLAVECFKFSKSPSTNDIKFTPKALNEVKCAKFFYPEIYHPNGNIDLALDALNHNIDPTTPRLFSEVKKRQGVIAKYLKFKINQIKLDLLKLENHNNMPLLDSTFTDHKIKSLRKEIHQLEIEAQKWLFCAIQDK